MRPAASSRSGRTVYHEQPPLERRKGCSVSSGDRELSGHLGKYECVLTVQRSRDVLCKDILALRYRTEWFRRFVGQ